MECLAVPKPPGRITVGVRDQVGRLPGNRSEVGGEPESLFQATNNKPAEPFARAVRTGSCATVQRDQLTCHLALSPDNADAHLLVERVHSNFPSGKFSSRTGNTQNRVAKTIWAVFHRNKNL